MGRAARALTGVLACAALAAPAGAAAATIPVDTSIDELGDGTDCSLREAVQAANVNAAVDVCPAGSPGLDTIVLGAGTFGLALGGAGEDANAQGDLDVIESLAIQGAGSADLCPTAGVTCIDANDLDRALDVRNGAVPVSLTLRGLTIVDGRVVAGPGGAISSQETDATLILRDTVILSSEAASGGAISSAGTTDVGSSLLAGNKASAGAGAISQTAGQLSVSASVLDANVATVGAGGAIAALGGASAALSTTRVTANRAEAGRGGGVSFTGAGSLGIAGSTFEENRALSGGGLSLDSPAQVAGSTFDANRATGSCGGGEGSGGGIALIGSPAGSMTLVNSTISENSAACRGGGMRVFGSLAVAQLTHMTITLNTALAGGGGLDNEDDGGGPSAATLRASILAGNGPFNCGGDGSRTSAGYNIESAFDCGLIPAQGDRPGTDPALGRLGFNGGRTRTQFPFTISPALNLVAQGCPGPDTDQRGFPRPIAGRCDAGAVEAGPAPLCVAEGASITGTPGNDTLQGTEGRDVIAGLGGDDIVIGLGGNDVICAGAGNDWVVGGPGNDRVRGESGADKLLGNNGKDLLEGGLGNDRLVGGRGKDKLDGGPGRDKLIQGSGKKKKTGNRKRKAKGR